MNCIKLALVTPAVLVAACVASPEGEPGFGDPASGKADGDSSDGIYSVRNIQYRCPGDACKALDFRKVNLDLTACPDGGEEVSCLVTRPQVDWRGTGLSSVEIEKLVAKMPYGSSDDQKTPVLIRAHYRGETLVVEQAWIEGLPGTIPPSSMYGVVQDETGALREQHLNVGTVTDLGDLDLETAQLSARQVKAIYDALPTGVIVAGKAAIASDGSTTRGVNQFWTRYRP